MPENVYLQQITQNCALRREKDTNVILSFKSIHNTQERLTKKSYSYGRSPTIVNHMPDI